MIVPYCQEKKQEIHIPKMEHKRKISFIESKDSSRFSYNKVVFDFDFEFGHFLLPSLNKLFS